MSVSSYGSKNLTLTQCRMVLTPTRRSDEASTKIVYVPVVGTKSEVQRSEVETFRGLHGLTMV